MTRKAGSLSCAAIYHFQETESSMHRNEVASPKSAHSPTCAVERPHRRLSGYSRISAQTALPERTSNAIVRRQRLAVHPAVLKAPGRGWRVPRSERADSMDSATTSQTPRLQQVERSRLHPVCRALEVAAAPRGSISADPAYGRLFLR